MEVHLVHFANFAKPQTVGGKANRHHSQTDKFKMTEE